MTSTVPVPVGFRLVLDPDTKRLDDRTLFGGSPARILRLSEPGRRVLDEVLGGRVRTETGGRLARRLTDAGVVHPRSSRPAERADVTVLIPVRDRAPMLDRCLTALGAHYPVLVIDDGSVQPELVAAAADRHGAALIVSDHNRGPGAARNLGLRHTTSEFVVFLDSDCVPPPEFIDGLLGHLDDPVVAAVAPRVAALPSRTSAGRYAAACGSLDLGDREARVTPGSRVGYVPTAALIARRAALSAMAADGAVFDEALRYGEDVDLVWRLDEAGWRVRYDPSVVVEHDEPAHWRDLMVRRHRYGTSAGPLACRHPQSMAPFVLHPWSGLAAGALLARRPVLAAAAFAGSAVSLRRTLCGAGVEPRGVVRGCATAVHQTLRGLARLATQFAAPVVVGVAVTPGRPARRFAAAALLLTPPLTTWFRRRPELDPLRFSIAHLADDVAYGSGVIAGAVRARTSVPLRPVISRRMLRVDAAAPRTG